jgi:hypothetical protein
VEGLVILINIYNKVKICNKCHIPKVESEFYKNKATRDGLQSSCKECQSKIVENYKKLNSKKIKQSDKDYKDRNKEKCKEQDRQYYLKHKKKPKKINICTKEYYKEYSKKWNEDNKEKRKEVNKKWLNNNIHLIKERNRNRYKEDVQYKLKSIVSSNIRHALKRVEKSKNFRSKIYLGCDIIFYKNYLESLFLPEMNWGNYGKIWEIDHKQALSNFNLLIEENQFEAFNYKNTEPRFITNKIAESLGYKGYIGNREKSNKIF